MLLFFGLLIAAIVVFYAIQSARNRKGAILHLISKKGYISSESIEIFKAHEGEIDRLIRSGMSNKKIVNQILNAEKENQEGEEPFDWVKEVITNHFFIYLFIATIVIILIAIFTDGSGPYTGGDDKDYIWKPSRR